MRNWLIPLMLALSVTVAGCTGQDKQAGTENDTVTEVTENPVEDTVGSATDAVEAGKNAATDATVTAKVKTVLATIKDVDATSINVDTKAGVVTLKGSVPTAEAETNALSTAKKVEGVRKVVDELEVGTPGPNDGVPESGPAKNSSPVGN